MGRTLQRCTEQKLGEERMIAITVNLKKMKNRFDKTYTTGMIKSSNSNSYMVLAKSWEQHEKQTLKFFMF